jgi:hypothetical protein
LLEDADRPEGAEKLLRVVGWFEAPQLAFALAGRLVSSKTIVDALGDVDQPTMRLLALRACISGYGLNEAAVVDNMLEVLIPTRFGHTQTFCRPRS